MMNTTFVGAWARVQGYVRTRGLKRALVAVPVGIVLFFVTLLFTALPATQLLQGDSAAVFLVPSFPLVVVGTVVVVAAYAAFAFTYGRRLDLGLDRYPEPIAAAVMGSIGAALGLIASFVMLAAVSLVDGVASGEAFVAILLVLALPAVASGLGTRLVAGSTEHRAVDVAVAYGLAVVAIGLFWWAVEGYY